MIQIGTENFYARNEMRYDRSQMWVPEAVQNLTICAYPGLIPCMGALDCGAVHGYGIYEWDIKSIIDPSKWNSGVVFACWIKSKLNESGTDYCEIDFEFSPRFGGAQVVVYKSRIASQGVDINEARPITIPKIKNTTLQLIWEPNKTTFRWLKGTDDLIKPEVFNFSPKPSTDAKATVEIWNTPGHKLSKRHKIEIGAFRYTGATK